MGLFGKKKWDGYYMRLEFDYRINYEEDILTPLFEACDTYGFPLLSEPDFHDKESGLMDLCLITFKLSENISGAIQHTYADMPVEVTISRGIDSRITEDILAQALYQFLIKLPKCRYSASKGKDIYHTKRWDEFYELASPHKKFT